MKSKNIYIHIGAHKTGTTAIQKFMAINRNNLKKRGYLYPGEDDAHHIIPHTILGKKGNIISLKTDLDSLIEEIDKSKYNNIVISSEDFEHLKEKVSELDKYLSAEYNYKIIYYVRRQDDMLESVYNQITKNPSFQKKTTFNSFLDSYESYYEFDYYAILSSWQDFFGTENIIVRVYEDEQLPNGIFSDFIEAIGLKWDDFFIIPEKRINPRLDWDFIELNRICKDLFKSNKNMYQFLYQYILKNRKEDPKKKLSILSPLQRREIINNFHKSNSKVAREYLKREDGTLFYAPLPESDELWEHYDGLTFEKTVPLFTQMIYNMDTKYQSEYKIFKKGFFSKINYSIFRVVHNISQYLKRTY